MIYLCNENLPSIEIYFDNENCRSNFIEKYKDYFNKDFILYYTDDILGLISYYLLSTISQVSEFTFKIYCKTKQIDF